MLNACEKTMKLVDEWRATEMGKQRMDTVAFFSCDSDVDWSSKTIERYVPELLAHFREWCASRCVDRCVLTAELYIRQLLWSSWWTGLSEG